MRAWTIPCLAALLAATTAPGLQAQSDKEAALAVVKQVFDGMRARDTVLMRSLFAPGGRLIAIGSRDGSPPTMQALDPGVWLAGVARGTGPGPDERTFDPIIQIDDNIAQVWTYYELWVGSRLNHCGYDAFFLVKLGNEWKIGQVADTRRTACTPRS